MSEAYLNALYGGVIIGLATSFMMLFIGKVCGISGICGRILYFRKEDFYWRLFFLLGLIFGGYAILQINPNFSTFTSVTKDPINLIIAGLLVGYGTRLANGCTSGHCIVGVSRFSKRSIVATIIFISVGMLTVYIIKNI